jgi:murein DD-endopeptidase MepM/ murein hydrolase activator NlpD
LGLKLGALVIASASLFRTYAGVSTDHPALLALPIAGLTAKDLVDTFDQMRGTSRHEAIDIMEPRGTPVQAVVPGMIVKLFLSKPGGNTIYLFDESQFYCYYYAHLDRYAANLHEGQHVSPGDVIGFVGSTGNANPAAPHLHFAIFRLGSEKHWWHGTPVNPYAVLLELVFRSGSIPRSPPRRHGLLVNVWSLTLSIT